MKAFLNVAFWVIFVLFALAFVLSAGCSIMFLAPSLLGRDTDLLFIVLLFSLVPLFLFLILVLMYRGRPSAVPANEKERKNQSAARALVLFILLGWLVYLLNAVSRGF
jgi:uncharacterized BrkB/YihY/UPF0761 family membrane protein